MLPAYSAVPPSTAPTGNRSVTASDSEESEYEEVEIEEEIEVEEEVTGDEEEDEEEEGNGEDLSLSIEHRYDEKRNITIISNDIKSSQYDGGIMIVEINNSVNESNTQVNASDKVPHSDEQTTQLTTKDANDAQQSESRLQLDPAMEIDHEDMRDMLILTAPCNGNDITKGSSKKKVDPDVVCPDKLTGQSLSKKRKNRSKDRKHVFSDLGLSSGDGAGLGPLTKDEVCHEIRSGQQVTRMHVSAKAGCLMDQAMGSVSQLIKCYDIKVKKVKRLRDRIKHYREKKLRNAKRLKKLESAARLASEKEKETLRLMVEKEAEHKKEVCDLMEKLENANRENVQLQRENAGIANR